MNNRKLFLVPIYFKAKRSDWPRLGEWVKSIEIDNQLIDYSGLCQYLTEEQYLEFKLKFL